MIERLLQLRPGDFRRGLPLFSYYFLIISSSQIGQVARDSLVLDRFSAFHLPYLDIAVSVLIGFTVAVYIRLGRLSSLRSLLIGSLCFYVATVGIIWWAIRFYQPPWVSLVLYIWVGIFGALAPAQVWTLANFLWTTREAKRLFGMVGSGGIVGGIFAGFLSARVTSMFGAENLLLLMAIPLLGAVLLVSRIWKERPSLEDEEVVVDEGGPQNLRDSLRLIVDSAHLRVIAGLVFLSSVVATIAAWQTKAIAQQTFVSKDALGVFFGHFDGFVCVIALAAQLFITAKVLQRFGVGVALAALPVSLLVGSGAVVVWGTLWAVCLAKGSDRVFRYSIDTAAQQLLYLPVSSQIKLQVKSFIDTVVWRFGGGFGGLLLLFFATRLGLTAQQVGWLCLILVGAWLAIAFKARQQYVAILGFNIRQNESDSTVEEDYAPDRHAGKSLVAQLQSGNRSEILDALSFYNLGRERQVFNAIRGLLDHPAPAVRARAISILRETEDREAHATIVSLLQDDDLQVRTEALEYLSVHDHIDPIANIGELEKFSDFSICSATIAFLARPGASQNLEAARLMLDVLAREPGEKGTASRRAAARLIGSLPDYFEVQLDLLLADEDPEVVRNALRSMGSLRRQSLVPTVIERLDNPLFFEDACEALVQFENSILDTLAGYLGDANLRVEVRRRIPEVLLRIGTRAASKALAENVLQADSVLRYRIIWALNKLQEMHQHPPLDRDLIETVMIAEIMGHSRSYQILGVLDPTMTRLLTEAMKREVERIFRLLKLLFPTVDLENAYLGIQSRDHTTHANALEFLENTLSPSVRTLLIPLIDSEIDVSERIRLANTFLHTNLRDPESAVAAMVHSEDPWLKACAFHLIERLKLKTFAVARQMLLESPDPMVKREIENNQFPQEG